nr:hypothetical protein [Tanacetum cinerariifolium]
MGRSGKGVGYYSGVCESIGEAGEGVAVLAGKGVKATVAAKSLEPILFIDFSLGLLHTDEAPDAIIKCMKNIQVRLNAIVRNVGRDNGTEFVNRTLREFYENVGITHQTSVARTPQQNGQQRKLSESITGEPRKSGKLFIEERREEKIRSLETRSKNVSGQEI